MTPSPRNIFFCCFVATFSVLISKGYADLVTVTASTCADNKLQVNPLLPFTELQNVITETVDDNNMTVKIYDSDFNCALFTAFGGFPLNTESFNNNARFQLIQNFTSKSFAVAFTLTNPRNSASDPNNLGLISCILLKNYLVL